MIKILFRILFLTLIFVSGTSTPNVHSQPSILNQIIQTQPALVDIKSENMSLYKSGISQPAFNPQTGRFVLLQSVRKASYERAGAGVIIHPSGVIVTNAHIVQNANLITATLHDGTQLSARVVRVVKNLDIALLKIDPPFPLTAVAIADSDAIKLGAEIITVGNSPVLNQTITGGKIIGIGSSRSLKNHEDAQTDLIQTSFNLYEGDSGGPLFDHNGQLIGLMTAKEMAADHSSFAVPSNQIAKYLNEYLKQNQGHEVNRR